MHMNMGVYERDLQAAVGEWIQRVVKHVQDRPLNAAFMFEEEGIRRKVAKDMNVSLLIVGEADYELRRERTEPDELTPQDVKEHIWVPHL